MSKPCVFCEIVAGRKESHLVFEDGETLAFLDHNPLFPGHVLLIPREHHVTVSDLPQRLVAPVFQAVRLLCQAVQEGLAAEGTFMAVNNGISQSVPHLHVHVIPRRKGDGLKGFFWPRHKYESEAHLAEVQARIREAAQRLVESAVAR